MPVSGRARMAWYVLKDGYLDTAVAKGENVGRTGWSGCSARGRPLAGGRNGILTATPCVYGRGECAREKTGMTAMRFRSTPPTALVPVAFLVATRRLSQ